MLSKCLLIKSMQISNHNQFELVSSGEQLLARQFRGFCRFSFLEIKKFELSSFYLLVLHLAMQLSKILRRVVIVGLLATLWAVCESASVCPSGLPPAGLPLEVNDGRRGQPLYWLDVGRARFGYRPHRHYHLNITSSDSDYPFSDAILTFEEEDPSTGCGIGHFQIDTDELYQYPGCNKVLQTNKKQPMTNLPPFTWKAPGCGCVIVKATVIRDGLSYYMDENLSDGVLSKRLCPREHEPIVRSSKVVPIHTTSTTTVLPTTTTPRKMNRAERTDLLCKISLKFNGAELLAREVFLRRRQISKLNITSLIRLELALDQRRGDIHQCCKGQSIAEKTRCFDNTRRRRVDRFCRVGVPDIPFTARRAAFMKEKEEDCCWRLGESRYRCFGEKSNVKVEKGHNSVDYSQDEMDPVNDIGDYPIEIEEVEKDLNSDFFVDDTKKDAVIRVRETVTYTVPKTTSSTATLATTPVSSTPLSKEADTKVRRHLPSGVIGDNDKTKNTMRDTTAPLSIKRSAVDEELEVLGLKKWKLETKYTCCVKGKAVGENIDVQLGIYNHCRKQWRSYRKSLKKGKNLCMNKYMECCVNEAGISSTQATQTQTSNPSHAAVQTRVETTTQLPHQTQIVTSARRGQGQGRSHGSAIKRKGGGNSKKTESTDVQMRRTKGRNVEEEIRSNLETTSSVSILTSTKVTSPQKDRSVGSDKEDDEFDVEEEEIEMVEEEDSDKSDEREEVEESKNGVTARRRSKSNSKRDGGEEEDINQDDRAHDKKRANTKTLRNLKPKRHHLRVDEQRATTIPSVESVGVDSVFQSDSRTVSRRGKSRSNSRGNSRPRRVRKHKQKQKRRRLRNSRNDKL